MSVRLLLVCIVWVMAGCDIFQTRDPEAPTQNTSGFKPPDTPEIVLDNLAEAVKTHNTDQYMRCLVDTTASQKRFLFSASGDFQGTFAMWGLEDEQRYFQNLGTPVNAIPYLSFSGLQQQNRTSTDVEFTMQYLLFYPHSRVDVPRQVQGYMHLYMEVDGQHRWSIYRWDDARTVTDSTWSYLKRAFN